MRIIGITGLSGSGKTTAAGFIAMAMMDMGYGVVIDAFAAGIKQKLRKHEGWRGEKDACWRERMQKMGTECRKRTPDYFIRCLAYRNCFMEIPFQGYTIWQYQGIRSGFLIVSDMRYYNEFEFVRANGVTIYLCGSHAPLDGAAAEHKSEIDVPLLLQLCDYIITRHEGLETLKAELGLLVKTHAHEWEEGDK